MRNIYLISVITLVLIGCGGSKDYQKLNGEILAKQKCASCHNLDMPPKFSDNEKAPPLFTVTVHLKDWIKPSDPSALRGAFLDFVSDYVVNPTKDKAYCDKDSIKKYGYMPSLKGKVTKDEAKAIADYIFDIYDQMKMAQIIKEQNRIKSLPPYKQVLETKDCASCHIHGKNIAPTFKNIAKKYSSVEPIKKSITEGSKGKWNQFHLPMRAYKDLTQKQLDGISKWILEQK